ncbi:MAG TPA: helix-turn-helix domain-containing protein [Mycobacteriales bacterium]|nr:helix-turn-helix domain-containing protein [Mycobacteriales bacterium]
MVGRTGSEAQVADAAATRIQHYLALHTDEPTVSLRVDGVGETLTVPRAAVTALTQVLVYMAAGQDVSVLPTTAELTTQQAADLLKVSRPYLIGLLESGEIDFRKVGSHRRVPMQSLLSYRRRDDARRREAADILSAETRELGLH